MRLDGIHHISAITGDAAAQRRLLHARARPAHDRQDRQPGRSRRLPPLLRRRARAPRRRPDVLRVPRRGARPPRRRHGAPDRVARRLAGGDRLLGGAPGGRGRRRRELARRRRESLRFADPEGLEHELVVSASPDPPLVAEHPEIPAEHALQGFEGVRAYSRNPARSAAMLERLMGAQRIGDEDRWELRGPRRGGWIAFDPAPAERGRQSAGVVHHVAFGTTDADLPSWIARIDRRRRPQQRLRRPPLLPLAVLPRAERRPVRARDGRARASPSTARSRSSGRKLILPPFLEPRRERDRGAPDAAARSARGLGARAGRAS